MWEGQPGRVSVARHPTELFHETKKPVHLAPYHAGAKSKKSEKIEIENMLSRNTVERALMEPAAQIAFAPKMDESLRFFVYYHKLDAATKRDLNLIPQMGKCIDPLDETAIFFILDTNRGY